MYYKAYKDKIFNQAVVEANYSDSPQSMLFPLVNIIISSISQPGNPSFGKCK